MDMLKKANEYAADLYEMGFTFDEFAAQYPNLAASEYGKRVKSALDFFYSL